MCRKISFIVLLIMGAFNLLNAQISNLEYSPKNWKLSSVRIEKKPPYSIPENESNKRSQESIPKKESNKCSPDSIPKNESNKRSQDSNNNNEIDATANKDTGRLVIITYKQSIQQRHNLDTTGSYIDIEYELDSVIYLAKKVKITEIKYMVRAYKISGERIDIKGITFKPDGYNPPMLEAVNKSELLEKKQFSYKERDTTITANNLRKLYRSYYFNAYGNPRFFFRFTAGFHMAHRQFLVDNPSFNQSEALNQRSMNEDPIFSSMQELSLGVKLGRSNYLTFPFVNLNQGFRSTETAINWQTGLPAAAPGKTYRFNFKGLGLGYSYNNFRRKASARFDAQLLWMKLIKFKESGTEFPVTPFKDNYIIGSIGIGGNIRITKDLSMGIVPTFYYDFTPVQRGELQTRLYNLGLNLSLTGAILKN